MKAIFISIALCIVYSVSFCQPLSALRSPKEIKPVVGEMVTLSNTDNLEERTHKLLKYTTPDGGQGTFLKYAAPDQSPLATVEKAFSTLKDCTQSQQRAFYHFHFKCRHCLRPPFYL